MDGRATTNVLLAIIAGVLLFGSAATVGVLQWIAIALAALVVVYLLAMLVGAVFGGAINAIQEVVTTWQGDASPYEKWSGAAGLLLLPIWIWAGLTIAWFWLQGVEHPAEAVTHTYAGWAALAGMCVLGAGIGVIVLSHAGRWLWSHRGELPARIVHGALMWAIGLFAVVVLPIQEWRSRRAAGAGIVGLVAAPAGMLVAGIAISTISICLTVGVFALILVGLGIVD